MSQPSEAPKTEAPKTAMQRILDVVEKVGNKVPHPVIIFLILIGIVVVLSHLLHVVGVSHTHEAIATEAKKADPAYTYDAGTADEYRLQTVDETKAKVEARTTVVRSLLTTEGIRFIYS